MIKIMLVEDEQDLRENITSLLLEKGFDVISAENGLEVLKMLEQEIPDLIISDIMMPFLDGYELFQRVKEKSKTKIIPFIFLTAKSDLSSIRRGMNLGADDYITKPFSSADLLRAIQIRLEKSKFINNQIDEIRDSISKYVPHELRTPLVAILGYSQIIISELEKLDKNDIMEMTERINISAKRLHNRIEKFIQLSDLEPVTKSILYSDASESNIDYTLIKEIASSYYYLMERKEKIEIFVEPAEVKIPSRFLTMTIKELLENATKFSDSNTSICVNGNKGEKVYKLEIKDFGIGMEDYQISRIGAFQQFNRDEYQQEGNGLGLVIVKRILENCNGSLIIESQKHSFTKVIVTIPLVE